MPASFLNGSPSPPGTITVTNIADQTYTIGTAPLIFTFTDFTYSITDCTDLTWEYQSFYANGLAL